MGKQLGIVRTLRDPRRFWLDDGDAVRLLVVSLGLPLRSVINALDQPKLELLWSETRRLIHSGFPHVANTVGLPSGDAFDWCCREIPAAGWMMVSGFGVVRFRHQEDLVRFIMVWG